MRALVLSGGGRKGAYEVGVLRRWMGEEGRDYDILCGTSVGALNAGALAQVKLGNPQEAYRRLADIWDRVSNRNIRRFWWFWYLAALWKPSLYDSKPLLDWVRKELSPTDIAASGRKLRVGAVSWNTLKARVADEKSPRLADWIYSSACFPLGFKPIEIDGDEWMDWGVRDVTPIGAAIEAGATEIDVITTFNPDLPEKRWDPWYKAVPARGLRVIEALMDEVTLGDLRAVGDRNEIAVRGGKYREVKLNIQMPSQPLMGSSLDFDPAKVREEREFGYLDSAPSR